jgi:tRNA(fMet)-specific endonuclease VapC
MYLLDTNHASRIMDDGDPALRSRMASLDPDLLTLCPIVSGELTFMVERSSQREHNRSRLDDLLGLLGMREITHDVAREYGQLKSAIVARFGPKDARRKADIVLRDIGVSDNDLWIAAVARHYDLILVSQDSDFERIAEVTSLTRESWLSA